MSTRIQATRTHFHHTPTPSLSPSSSALQLAYPLLEGSVSSRLTFRVAHYDCLAIAKKPGESVFYTISLHFKLRVPLGAGLTALRYP